MARRVLLGDLLISADVITHEQLTHSLDIQSREGKTRQLGQVLIGEGYLTESQIALALSRQMGIAVVNLDTMPPGPMVRGLVPVDLILKHMAVPIAFHDNTLTMAMADPTNVRSIDDIRTLTGYRVDPAVAARSEILRYIQQYYARDAMVHAEVGLEDLSVSAHQQAVDGIRSQMAAIAPDIPTEGMEITGTDEANIIDLVDQIITRALKLRASDLHFVPTPLGLRTRFRIDGRLRDGATIAKKIQSAVLARIKILSDLDVTEHRRAQEGHARIVLADGDALDLRVSFIPTMYGETAVLRLLEHLTRETSLNTLGFTVPQQEKVNRYLSRPQGLVVVTGPTGSGKTTSLYAMLRQLNEAESHIITLEDPIEYEIPGISQVQVDEGNEVSFSTGIRSMVRLDPDVIMVGEIRDLETATIAFQAALTGHLVLTTLHTNDAISAVARLTYMGVEPYLVSSALSLVLSQRLVRRVCSYCHTEDASAVQAYQQMGDSPEGAEGNFLVGKGCDYCNNTGYRGRTGLFQTLEFDQGMRSLILDRAPESKLAKYAGSHGMRSLREEGIKLALTGETTLEEVLAVTEAT